jgi:hypothetical protein
MCVSHIVLYRIGFLLVRIVDACASAMTLGSLSLRHVKRPSPKQNLRHRPFLVLYDIGFQTQFWNKILGSEASVSIKASLAVNSHRWPNNMVHGHRRSEVRRRRPFLFIYVFGFSISPWNTPNKVFLDCEAPADGKSLARCFQPSNLLVVCVVLG